MSIDGEKISSLAFTIPNPSDNFPISYLRWRLRDFIIESDLIMGIYEEKGFDTYDESVPLDIFKDYKINLSLVCIKQGA